MVTDSIEALTARVAAKQAIQAAVAVESGVALGDGEVQQLTANTDQKITIYSTQNGEPKSILMLDAERVLAKKLSNGKPAHWIPGMPGSAPEYKRGTLKCYLHPGFDETDGPAGFDRAWLDAAGLAGRTCNMNAPDKNNRADFASAYDRDDHAAKKHPREWRTIEAKIVRDRIQREADERRATNEALMALARASLPAVATASTETVESATCDVPGCAYTNTQANVNRHRAMAHREATTDV